MESSAAGDSQVPCVWLVLEMNMTFKFSCQREFSGELGRWSERLRLTKQIQTEMGFLLLTQPPRYTTTPSSNSLCCFKCTQSIVFMMKFATGKRPRPYNGSQGLPLARYLSDLIPYDFPPHFLCSRHTGFLAVPQISQAHTHNLGLSQGLFPLPGTHFLQILAWVSPPPPGGSRSDVAFSRRPTLTTLHNCTVPPPPPIPVLPIPFPGPYFSDSIYHILKHLTIYLFCLSVSLNHNI